MNDPPGRPAVEHAEYLARVRLDVLADVRTLRHHLTQWNGLLTSFEAFLINDHLWKHSSAADLENITGTLGALTKLVQASLQLERNPTATSGSREKLEREAERLRVLLRARVRESGLTPEELGRRAGWSPKKVRGILREGGAPLKVENVLVVLAVLDVPAADFYRDYCRHCRP